MRKFVSVLGLVSLVTAGCIPTTHLDSYPGWDPDTCEISNDAFIGWADEIKAADVHFDLIPQDTQTAFNFCQAKIVGLGYKLRNKPKGVLGDFERYTTTLPFPRLPFETRGVIWLPPDWEERDLLHQMFTMCHEWVHAETEVRIGFGGSVGHYLTEEGRLSFEMAPYWVSFALRRRHGATDAQLVRAALRAVDSLHVGYMLSSIPLKCLKKTLLVYWEIPTPEGV